MLSIPVSHPDSEEFIDIKTKNDSITKANISLMVDDAFMEAVKSDSDYRLHWEDEEGRSIEKTIRARDLFNKNVKNNWDWAEAGFLFWDTIEKWHLMSEVEGYELAGTNPCVTGDTLVLTDKGNIPIVELVGKKTNIWNGFEWSEVVPSITGYNQDILSVKLSNGKVINCTPYHEFVLKDGSRVKAKDLTAGDKLSKFNLPVVEFGEDVGEKLAYTQVSVRVDRVDYSHVADTVYCFTEPKNHTGVFNGVMTGQCGELPLVGGGSCLLGSLNLSEFVLNPFTKDATFDEESFKKAVKIAVRGLNDVLDEGENLHPLEAQRESVKDYRQIGLGVMGFADFLIKMGIKYGDEESIKQSTIISNIMAREAIKQSALLAKERGPFRKFDLESILKSPYLQRNADEVTIGLIKEYGLRNSQILAIAPTGSLSTLLGISGGIEPIFAKEFTRKTESVHNEDVYYKVYTPIVKEALEEVGHIPDYVVTSHDIDSSSRVKIQATWQKAIDSAISSTINLPKETTPEMVGELFIKAWQDGLKGVTIFRDGCKRAGILTLEDDIEEPTEEKEIPKEVDKYQICSECGEKIEVIQNGCTICMNCGHSPC